MASIGWKKFKFFDEERHTGAPFPEGVTTACAGINDDVWLACADGLVVCMDRDLSIKSTFPAFKGKVHHLNVSKGKLVALGEEAEGLRSLTLKIWDISNLRSGTTPPAPASQKLFAASKLPEGTLQAAAAYVDEWPAVSVALGTSASGVHIYKGDATKGKLTPAPFGCRVLRGGGGDTSTGAPQKSGSSPPSGITAVHFAGSGNSLHLFALTAGSLAAISLATGQFLLEDECGAVPGCAAVTSGGELLVAGSDAVHFYTAEEGRKAAVAIKGSKHAVVAFRHYIAAAVPDDSSATSSSSSSNNAARSIVLRIFDASNKVVAATATINPPLKWIVAGSRGILTADSSGAAIRFWEKPLEQRLESLFRSRSFQLALRIAQMESASVKTIAEVKRYFGDFLYSKRDYDAAAVQYAGTVGVLEPSYVIQKFLDAQRVHNLTTYLEAVHEEGIATADHTTLLLNCYTKLRDVSKIDQFVQQANKTSPLKGSGGGFQSGTHLPYDASAAIAVLHSAGYNDHAVFVALAAGRTDDYLSILLEDCHRFDEGLKYIRGLGRRRAAAALHKFGNLLLQGDSVATTTLLMELCLPATTTTTTSNTPSTTSRTAGTSTSEQQHLDQRELKRQEEEEDAKFVANLTNFTHLYTERPDDLQYACVTILAMGHPDLPSKQTLYHTLLDLYLCTTSGSTTTHSDDSTNKSQITRSAATLPDAGGPKSAMPAGHAEALDLLKRGWQPGQDPAYDVDRALTTCRLHEFPQGLVFLYTNRRDFREAAAVLADAHDWPALLEICHVHGSAATGGDPEVWHDALEQLSSPAAASPGADAALRELLSRIEAEEVMPPMAVLPILAKNPHLRLELVRDYVIRALENENRTITADVEEAQRLKEEVRKSEDALKKLTTEPVIFQSSRDSQTGAPLEVPSVHFLCGHSFNLRTLGDGAEGQECPLCASEHRKNKRTTAKSPRGGR
ncbi:hypothetical protein Ndes2526B_g04250 [Nannochloris sp. 'desiccata']